MPRTARKVDRIPKDILEAATVDFPRCALKALEGQIANQRELADRLGWPETTLSSALKGRFTFRSWPMICRALGLDPIDALVRGREKMREDEDRAREASYRQMIERAEADTLVEFWCKLPVSERQRVTKRLNELESRLTNPPPG